MSEPKSFIDRINRECSRQVASQVEAILRATPGLDISAAEAINRLHARIAELESDASSADAVMQEYAEVMQAAGCKSKAELLKKTDPPPDGYASWEDWLLTKDVRIYEFDGKWKVEWSDGESDYSTYPYALEAAKKEAGYGSS